MKILTMQVYMPTDHTGLWTYGTCLHDDEQAAAARKDIPPNKAKYTHGKNAPCAVKFPFVNNTAGTVRSRSDTPKPYIKKSHIMTH